MPLQRSTKRWLIWVLVVTSVIILRVACVFYERSRTPRTKLATQKVLDKDYLVVLPKFYVDDLNSARKLVGRILWVKAGYQARYFPMGGTSSMTPLTQELQFEPMESLTVDGVTTRPVSEEGHDQQVLLLFRKGGQSCATVGGFFLAREKQYQMQLDELFFARDPRELYSHWPPEVWDQLRTHQLKPGMSFAQVGLSMGNRRLIATEAGESQRYEFSRRPGGGPGKTRVRFSEGRVSEVEVRE